MIGLGSDKKKTTYITQTWLPTREKSSDWGCGNCTSHSHGTLANSSTDELTPRISQMPPYQGCVQTYLCDRATFDVDNHFTITWSGQVKAVIILDWGRLIRKSCQQSQKAEQKKNFRVSWMAMSGHHLSCACTSRNLREPVESWLLTTSCWIGAKRYEMSGEGGRKRG